MRFLCKVSSNMKFTRFQQTTALQHCKLILPRSIGFRRDEDIAPYQCGDRGGCPPMTVSLSYVFRSFHFSSRFEVGYTAITKSPYWGN